MAHTACEVAREGRQVAQTALGILSHKHSQHLSSRHFIGPIRSGDDIFLHPVNRHECQRMGLIQKRTREPWRQPDGRRLIAKQMELFDHGVQQFNYSKTCGLAY